MVFLSFFWYNISIHAPVKGATYIELSRCGFLRYFNPRTREGCDEADAFTV